MKRPSVSPSVCLSVPSIDCGSGVPRVCCWAPRRQDRQQATALSSKCGQCPVDSRRMRLNRDLLLTRITNRQTSNENKAIGLVWVFAAMSNDVKSVLPLLSHCWVTLSIVLFASLISGHCAQRWRHTWNRKYITYRNVARELPRNVTM